MRDATGPDSRPVLEAGGIGASSTDYVLPPITVVVPGCDPYTDLNGCQGGDDCMMSSPPGDDSQSTSGCLPKIRPDGGTTPPTCPTWDPACNSKPPPPEPSDTCRTGDPVLDSPGVEMGFADLWNASNPDSVMEKRRERGGWVVPDGTGGYAIQPFAVVSSNACEIVVDMANRPGNAVAFVHTHPYETGLRSWGFRATSSTTTRSRNTCTTRP